MALTALLVSSTRPAQAVDCADGEVWDDGSFESSVYAHTGLYYAQFFPVVYPSKYTSVCLGLVAPSGTVASAPILLQFYGDAGAKPGSSLHAGKTVTATNVSTTLTFYEFDVSDISPTFTSANAASCYLKIDLPSTIKIGLDTTDTAPLAKSFELYSSGFGSTYAEQAGRVAARAHLQYSGPAACDNCAAESSVDDGSYESILSANSLCTRIETVAPVADYKRMCLGLTNRNALRSPSVVTVSLWPAVYFCPVGEPMAKFTMQLPDVPSWPAYAFYTLDISSATAALPEGPLYVVVDSSEHSGADITVLADTNPATPSQPIMNYSPDGSRYFYSGTARTLAIHLLSSAPDNGCGVAQYTAGTATAPATELFPLDTLCTGNEIHDDGGFEAWSFKLVPVDYFGLLTPTVYPARYTDLCVAVGNLIPIAKSSLTVFFHAVNPDGSPGVQLANKAIQIANVDNQPTYYTFDVSDVAPLLTQTGSSMFVRISPGPVYIYLDQTPNNPLGAEWERSQDAVLPLDGPLQGYPAIRATYEYAGATEGEVEGGAEGGWEGEIPAHITADQDESGTISLFELSRLIQFYNSGGYHCADGTEDGYAPGPGDQTCAPHQTDYNPQDWVISLSELLRLVQFYNAGGYHACPNDHTEDGYCPATAG
jgi:hypothetical protein